MRTFVAIDLAESVRAALAKEQARLRSACARNSELRWTRPEGVHVTLKFLGEIPAERVAAVTAALEALRGFGRFEVEAKGFGFFPDARHPRVFWAGLEAPSALGELAGRVEAALAIIGFAAEDRPFRPHLTLARFRTPRADPDLAAALESTGSISLGRFEVDEFFLFESKLRPGGAEYLKLAAFPGARP
ncbi:MAG TPA: RNA 2',3'-cyclic phosphodiesterase [Terriglobia bacterium]|nr:RNA 2',3'-cyclic phosphodiesterase [Terriglobia bacterium]